MITRPTRITSHCATLIDNIYVNYAANTYDSGILINDITDHLPFFSFLGLNVEKELQKPKLRRCVTAEGLLKFKSQLSNVNWDEVL